MFSLRILRLGLFSLWLCGAHNSIAAAGFFSHLYVFGDSLSDTGNRASVSLPYPWPYYQNRVSNGPLAVDAVASELSLAVDASLHLIQASGGTNFAVAGATARGSQDIALSKQISAFLSRHGNHAPAQALYLILIGGNDIRDAAILTNINSANSIVDAAVNDIELKLRQLVQTGAKHLVVVNAPDIGLIPEARIIAEENNDPGLIARASALSNRFNSRLDIKLTQIETEFSIDIAEFDLYAFFNQLLANAANHGFTNITDACFRPNSFAFHPDCDYGSAFDEFVFFDEIHPTTKTHALIGLALADLIQNHFAQKSRHNALLPALLLLLLDDQ